MKRFPWWIIILVAIAAAILAIGLTTDPKPVGKAQPIAFQAPTESSVLTAPIGRTATTVSTPVTAPQAPEKPKVPSKPRATTTTQMTVPTGEDWPSPLAVAQHEVGKRGPYADNRHSIKPGVEVQGYWCAAFVSWVAEQASVPGWHTSNSPSELANDALRDGRATSVPHVGDLVFIDLQPVDGMPLQVRHVGIVESINGNELHTIEGNFNSDVVVRVVRHLNDAGIVGFAPFSK